MITFTDEDMPNMSSHCGQDVCGFSLYRGVLIQWDEDRDTRILVALDAMNPRTRAKLLVTQEHKGEIAFVWADKVPKKYQEGAYLPPVQGDVWRVRSSVALKEKRKLPKCYSSTSDDDYDKYEE